MHLKADKSQETVFALIYLKTQGRAPIWIFEGLVQGKKAAPPGLCTFGFIEASEPVFVVDITFAGGNSGGETVFARRPCVVVGPHASAHVTVAEMMDLGFSLSISRDVGRRFSIKPIEVTVGDNLIFKGGLYEGTATVDLGVMQISVVALDLDLVVRENEAIDRAGVRILRRACSDTVADFPAVLVTAPSRAIVSFPPDQAVVIGRSRQSGVRFDIATVSLQHARIGFESGQFWVEDLGSTNGTFVQGKQVSSRVSVAAGVPIHLGRNASVVGVTSREQLAQVENPDGVGAGLPIDADKIFPSLVSLSEVVRPSRIALRRGGTVGLGRDPGCDLWLGAPHVSRRHCEVHVSVSGDVRVTDTSTNGTVCSAGLLRSHESYETSGEPLVLDFGAGITVAICFTPEDEEKFKLAHGSPQAFASNVSPAPHGAPADALRKRRERRTTTWFNVQALGLDGAQAHGPINKFLAMMSGLTPIGRVAIVLVVVGLVGIVGILGSMLVSGLRW